MDPKEQLLFKQKLEAILENAVDAIITIDEKGIIESANPATEKLFCYPVSDLIGQNVKILMPAPFAAEHDQYLQNYLSSGKRKIIGIGREVKGKRSDGSEFPIHLAVSEIIVDKHRIFTGIIRDISDVKRVEAKLVQNERLAAIGQMVAGLAHESRNSLQRSHACLANLALDVGEMPESLELVHKIQVALDDLNALLEEVRDYSAPINLERSPVDAERLIRDTWQDVLVSHVDSSQFEFELFRDDRFPDSMNLDHRRIRQVIWNFFENAIFATKESDSDNKISVNLTAEECDDDQQLNCKIIVTDSGSGIPPEHLRVLFEPFFTTKTKGTGLGLAICRRVVEAHGGTITAANAPDQGAKFTVTLPTKLD